MPAWISAYMTSVPDASDVTAILTDMEHEDLTLEVERVSWGWRIRFDAEQRPLELSWWHEPARVAEEIGEALEVFEDLEPENVAPLTDHIKRSRLVLGLEMGWSQVGDAGERLGMALLLPVVQRFDGVLRDAHDAWRAPQDGVLIYL